MCECSMFSDRLRQICHFFQGKFILYCCLLLTCNIFKTYNTSGTLVPSQFWNQEHFTQARNTLPKQDLNTCRNTSMQFGLYNSYILSDYFLWYVWNGKKEEKEQCHVSKLTDWQENWSAVCCHCHTEKRRLKENNVTETETELFFLIPHLRLCFELHILVVHLTSSSRYKLNNFFILIQPKQLTQYSKIIHLSFWASPPPPKVTDWTILNR